MYVGQGTAIRFLESWISLLDSLFFPGSLFRHMEPIYMVGIFQEAGDADSRARTRSQVEVDCFIIPYTFIRPSHLYQEYHVNCIVITNDGRIG